MAKDPAFLFFPADWNGGTNLFSRHEKGAYLDLLMAQFFNWALTIDDVKFILKEDFELWDKKIKYKFNCVDDDGRFFNQKLRHEQLKRRKYCDSRRENKYGNSKNSHMSSHMTAHMSSHMGNGNIINNNINNNIPYSEIVDYLNTATGKSFRPDTEATRKVIKARWKESRTIDDFKKVIDIKSSQWLKDSKMKAYLRPETLFGNKFESYLNEEGTVTKEFGEV